MHYILTEEDKKAIAAAKVLVDYCNGNNKECAYCVFSTPNSPCVLGDVEYYEFSQLTPFLEGIENSTLESISNVPLPVKEQEIKRMEHKQND